MEEYFFLKMCAFLYCVWKFSG